MSRHHYTPSREHSTEQLYAKRVERVFKLWNAENGEWGSDWDLNLEAFYAFLKSERAKLSPASWRQYRAALVWYLDTSYRVLNPNVDDVIERVKAISTEDCSTASATSASKKKSISDRELDVLCEELVSRHQQLGFEPGIISTPLATMLYLVATETTGLRPSEWYQSELDVESDDRGVDTLVRHVKNGKATNGRSHGQYRTLRFKNLTQERQNVLVRHFWLVKNLPSESAAHTHYQRCKSCLTYTTHKLWPRRKRRPSLYSGRHQMSANLKQADLPLRHIAALMGHATDETATAHYGRSKSGNGRGNEFGI